MGTITKDSKAMRNYSDIVNDVIKWGKENVADFEENEISDGYHTFNELYEFRKQYNAALFNEWGKKGKYNVHKSIRHYDGELCFGGNWFIVVALLPSGQITNHYKMTDWDLFNIPQVDKSLYQFDGHTPKDVLERLRYINENQ